MFRHELSTFLLDVLDTVALEPSGVPVGADDEPEIRRVEDIARCLGEDPEDVRLALLGLRAGHCLLEESVEFPGIEPMVRWTVHPQCQSGSSEPSTVTVQIAPGSPAAPRAR